MTEHKYVFQGPVGQMQLSHCTVYVQGIVQKLTTEDCEVNVTGIVNQRIDMNKRVFVSEPPKTNADIELAEKRRENSNLRWQVQQLQSEVHRLKQKNKKLREESKQPAEVPDDDVLVRRIIKLQEQIEKEREAHAKELDDLKDRLDTAMEINTKLRQHNDEVDRRSQEIADNHIDILATLMAAYPFTTDKDLEFEFGIPVPRIRDTARVLGQIKSPEARAEAREYLQKQHLELIQRRGGYQGNHKPRTRQVEKVDKKGKVLASYKSIVDAANRTGCNSKTIQKYCLSEKTIYMKDGITFRYKDNENQNS